MRNEWSQDIYNKACRFAAHVHQGQQVPGTGFPYLMHLTMVSMEAIAALCHDSQPVDAELAVQCAWLHDTIEDTATAYEDVAREFGTRVADGVLALSKDTTLAKPLQMGDSLRRIKQQPRAVWMVKLADRISNLQPPPAHWTPAKAGEYREEALEIYSHLI